MEIPGLNLKLFRETLSPDLKNLFIHGKEIRATVIKGGGLNEMALLRSGKYTFHARIEGGSIPDHEKVFLKVEKHS